jgi:hypothetical protein
VSKNGRSIIEENDENIVPIIEVVKTENRI